MGDSPGPLLRLKGVGKTFNKVPAVAAVDLDIGRGELFALLGASGSGKTTLLRLIAGLEQPDTGRIIIDGQDMTDVPAYRRPVNTVFQSYALFPHMSVRANIAFGLEQDGLPRGEIEARVGEMLELVQMSDFADRRPHQLSGGQKQRVALARSLAKLPKLLLLDEPMAALDRKLREQTRLELAAIQRRLGITFILVTHDQDEAMSLADRMAVMEAGRIAQIGSPREIYEKPTSRFIADFIGRANLIEGRIVEREADTIRVALAAGCEIRAAHPGPAEIGQTVWIALRPERLYLDDSNSSDASSLLGTVRQIEYLGDMSIIHVDAEGGQRLRVSSANRDGGATLPALGQTVRVAWATAAASVLTR